MPTDQYKADDAVITVDGEQIVGVAEGTFVEVSYNSDKYSHVMGSYGDQTRVESLDQSGEISLTLKQNSASLSKLKELAKSGEQIPVRVVDKSQPQGQRKGRRGVNCSVERPGFSRGDSVEEIEVVIKAPKITELEEQ